MKNMFFAFILITLFSCKKDANELPEATQTGANTFGAILNGAVWVPKGFGFAQTTPIVEARYSANNSIFINARNFASSPKETEFEIYIKDFNGVGTFQLNQTTNKFPNHTASYAYYEERKFTIDNEWKTNNQYTGWVNISFYDAVEKIVAGTFEFQAINVYGDPKPITVTAGRFDVNIQ
jgi:hypothetical protein